ncbi:MAG TPA: hypothetical protein VL171_16020 [Verrucomicrobiae bacterium]|nr:hypothetical protein [Verrucomicrobiae bacterium]
MKTFIKPFFVFVGLLLPVAVLAKGGNDIGSSTDWAVSTVCFIVIIILSMLLPLRATGFMAWMLATTCILGLGVMVCHAYLSRKFFVPYLGWVPPFILVAAIVYIPVLFLAVAAVAIYRGRHGRKANDLSMRSSELPAAGAAGSRSP